jgi:hypothetical protein
MSDKTVRYRGSYDRETEVVAWRAPDGREFLVCGTDDGYALRSPGAWESDDRVEFEADMEGQVFFEGESVGWRIPPEILHRTAAHR